MYMHNDNIRIRYRPHTMVLPVAKGNISYIINIYSNTFITYIYYLKKRYIFEKKSLVKKLEQI